MVGQLLARLVVGDIESISAGSAAAALNVVAKQDFSGEAGDGQDRVNDGLDATRYGCSPGLAIGRCL